VSVNRTCSLYSPTLPKLDPTGNVGTGKAVRTCSLAKIMMSRLKALLYVVTLMQHVLEESGNREILRAAIVITQSFTMESSDT